MDYVDYRYFNKSNFLLKYGQIWPGNCHLETLCTQTFVWLGKWLFLQQLTTQHPKWEPQYANDSRGFPLHESKANVLLLFSFDGVKWRKLTYILHIFVFRVSFVLTFSMLEDSLCHIKSSLGSFERGWSPLAFRCHQHSFSLL